MGLVERLENAVKLCGYKVNDALQVRFGNYNSREADLRDLLEAAAKRIKELESRNHRD